MCFGSNDDEDYSPLDVNNHVLKGTHRVDSTLSILSFTRREKNVQTVHLYWEPHFD
jgi:hypothetical protein